MVTLAKKGLKRDTEWVSGTVLSFSVNASIATSEPVIEPTSNDWWQDNRERSIKEMVNGGEDNTECIGTSDEVLEDEEFQEK